MSIQPTPVKSPAGYVSTTAAAFTDAAGNAVPVAAATPLPVTLAGAPRAGLGVLAYRALPSLHPAPPRLARRTSAAPLIAEADALVLDRRDPRLTPVGAPLVQTASGYPWDMLSRGGWIAPPTAGEAPFATAWGIRFLTDSPRIELRCALPGSLAIRVDGLPLGPAASVTVPANDPDGWTQPGLDFGDDVTTIRPRVTLAASGTGYAAGDVLRVGGGAGTPLALVVTATGADGAIAADGLAIHDWGALTALPAGAAATAVIGSGGSGSGATVTLTDDLGGVAQTGHTTRRLRAIEILFDGLTQLADVRVTRTSTVRAWPLAGPRLMTMQDSYGQVFADRPAGQWPYRAAARLGIDDVWTNAFGGTGFVAGARPYIDRLDEIAAHLPPPARPLVFVTQGSINDGVAASADALRAAVTAYWTAAFARLPADAVMVQTGILRAPGAAPDDSYDAAVRTGFAAAAAVADPLARRSGFVATRGDAAMMTLGGRAGAPSGTGATDHWIAGDAAHLTQGGHDLVGDAFAAALIGILARG